jgi:hypothetical protein
MHARLLLQELAVLDCLQKIKQTCDGATDMETKTYFLIARMILRSLQYGLIKTSIPWPNKLASHKTTRQSPWLLQHYL